MRSYNFSCVSGNQTRGTRWFVAVHRRAQLSACTLGQFFIGSAAEARCR